jgi:uncharacterized membrane protein
MKSSNIHLGICQICKKEKKISELIPGSAVNNSLVELFKSKGNSWDPQQFICLDDLNSLRNLYIQGILTDEDGKLSALEEEVMNSMSENDIISKNTNEDIDISLTFGQRVSDKIAKFGGSWPFIIMFGAFLFIWIIINIYVLSAHPFDPYPFILLNLILSCIAAIQAPIIMMSQNRQEDKDRIRAMHDYQVNLKAELEIRKINDKIDHLMTHQTEKLLEIQQIQIDLMEQIETKLKK